MRRAEVHPDFTEKHFRLTSVFTREWNNGWARGKNKVQRPGKGQCLRRILMVRMIFTRVRVHRVDIVLMISAIIVYLGFTAAAAG